MSGLYEFQEAAVSYLTVGKHIVVAGCGAGKTAIALSWSEQKSKESGKKKVLVVTTASKSRTGDFEEELSVWCSKSYVAKLTEFTVISWHKLAKWVNSNLNNIRDYIVIFDEIQKAKAGVSSGMGKAFLKIAERTHDWAGFTGTPGDDWMSFYPYFTACGFVKNKTEFKRKYAVIDNSRGYPIVTEWRDEDKLNYMWERISYSPDTSKVMAELPEQTHKVVTFKKPAGYNKILKTRENEEGEFLDTAGALCAELRRQCFTSDKKEWIKDFVEGLESGCVFFYNFIKTGDELEDIINKALPEDARVWRIDGKHHEIPTADTIGPHDMVMCQWQSGSEALNLQFLHYWVSVEACYSYSTSIQARGRIRRIGQKMPQFYYYLKTEHTIEDAVYEALKNKSDFAEDVWCASNNLIEEEE